MARPKQIPTRSPLTQAQIERALYVGSKEHKAKRWWGGLPGARLGREGVARRPKKQLTSICELVSDADQKRATYWVRESLRLGRFSYCEGDQTYPKHIWHRDENGQTWFGFCINGIAGTYKGWPEEVT